MTRRAVPATARRALLAAALATACAVGVGAVSSADVARGGPNVTDELLAALSREGAADVIVALDGPDLQAARSADRDTWSAAVAESQRAAIDSLPPGGFVVTRRYQHVPALAGRLSVSALPALATAPRVAAVALDPPLEPHLGDSVPFIGADKLHLRYRLTGRGVTVAVLDTGVDTNNIDLRDAIVDEACIIDPPTACPSPPHVAEDVDGHGTSVAGIIASRGRQSEDGVAPGASIVAVKALEERNNAVGSALVAALDWVLNRGEVDVVNMSLGGGGYPDYCDTANAYTQSLAAAIARLGESGAVVVASSGNDGSSTLVSSPACVEEAVSVGAIQDFADGPGFDPKVAQFTNRNKTLDILAPGVGIVAPSMFGQPRAFGGTSAAAPHVSGALALLMEAAPWAEPALLVDLLKEHGQRPNLRYGQITVRTLDVGAAYDALMRVTPTATGSAPETPVATPTTRPSVTPSGSATATLSFPTASPTAAPPSATPSPSATSTGEASPSATATRAVATATPTTDSPVATPTSEVRVYLPAASRP